jgi:hypothetical protein
MVSVPWTTTIDVSGGQHRPAMLVGHMQAVDELVDLQGHRHGHARLPEDDGQVGFLERELALDGVVMLVEGPAGDDDAHRPGARDVGDLGGHG